MKVYSIFMLMIGLFLIISCEETLTPLNEEELTIAFNVEFVKPGEGYKSEVKSFSNRRVKSIWIANLDGTVQIAREVLYDIVLENDKQMEFGYWFMKFKEDRVLLVIEDGSSPDNIRSWDYLKIEDEKTNFYKNYDEARILIDNNVVFYENSNDDFRVKEFSSGMQDGVEKSFAKIEFQGNARGFYDPLATINEYIITNGSLTDIVK